MAFLLTVTGAAQYTISTFVGGPPDGALATNIAVWPYGVVPDSAGNIYFSDFIHSRVYKVSSTGLITAVAGNGVAGFSGDGGPATRAQLYYPYGLALDSDGALYFADINTSRVRKVSGGIITTVAGGGSSLGDGGPATSAQLSGPSYVAFDSAGSIYIAEEFGNRIRKVTNGIITTVAGSGTQGYSGDGGLATNAQLNNPVAVAVDNSGNFFIVDQNNNRIRKVSGGIITTIVGTGVAGNSGDGGPALNAQIFPGPGLAVDNSGSLYLSQWNGTAIRKVTNGIINTIPPILGQSFLTQLSLDSSGALYIADYGGYLIRKITGSSGSVIAGNGSWSFSGDNGPAVNAQLSANGPGDSITFDQSGKMYVADQQNNRIRAISSGVIKTVAGSGNYPYSGDGGPATGASVYDASDMAVDSSGNIFIADVNDCRIRKVAGGIITTIAGAGDGFGHGCGSSGDGGPAANALLYVPTAVAVDNFSNLYIADSGNTRIRKIDSAGIITTVVGTGVQGFFGDGGLATNAQLGGYVYSLATDATGALYIADQGNGRVRKVSNGVINTVAGGGTSLGDGGPAISAQLRLPNGVALDTAGNLYIADAFNNRVRKVTGGVITTIAGNGTADYSGDGGPATNATLDYPGYVAVDNTGNVYVSDRSGRVRQLTPIPTTPITISTSPTGLLVAVDDSVLTAPQTFNWTQGSTHTIAVNSPQAGGAGTQYAFASWSDAGAQSHTISVPATPTTYTANFNTQYLLNLTVVPAGAGSIGGAGVLGSGYYNSGQTLPLVATANSGYQFSNWSGDLTGSTNPQSLTMSGPRNVTANFNVLIAIGTSPQGLTINVDGSTLTAPQNFAWVPGTQHNVSVSQIQTGAVGGRYNFASWSDGGALSHTITASNSFTDTANYTTQYLLTTAVTPSGSGSVGANPSSGDGYYNIGQSVQLTATANSGFQFSNWSGDVTGGADPQSVIMNAPHSVTANFGVPCSYGLLSSSASFGTAATNGNTAGVTASPSTCTWTASSPVNWVVFTTSSGAGSANAVYNVLSNVGSGPRSTTLTIAGLPFTVNQAGQGCQFGLTPASRSVGVNGGPFTATVGLSGSDCAWTASSNASWLHVTGSSGGAGGTLGYSVDSNTSSSVSRIGIITLSTAISQTTFTVTQAGALCTYTLSQASQSFTGAGGTGSTNVSAPGGCSSTVDGSGAPFVTGVTITPGGNSGSGNGTVSYTVPANPLTTTRTGTLIIAGQAYSISEAGTAQLAGCTASVASAPTVALEGRTEVLGDLLLNCANLSGATTADVVLTLNTNVTNTLTSGSTTNATLTVGGSTYNGQVLGYNAIHWPGVAIGPGTASLRISKVRADVSLLPGSNLQVVPVTGQVSFNGVQVAPIINGLQTMALAYPSLVFQKGQANPPTGGAQTVVPLIYQEGYASGFTATGTATRQRMVLTNIPATVQVYAPVYPNEGTNKAQLYSADSNGAGGNPVSGSPLAGGTYQQLTVTGGTAVATWVVLAADPSQVETWTFPLLLTNATNTDLNTIQVAGSVAVVSDVGVASATAPVPRYRDFSVPQKLVNLRLSVQTQTGTSSSKGPERSASLGQRSASYPVGSSVSFVYQLLNDTSDVTQAATNVTVRNNLPPGLSLVSCTYSGGDCKQPGNQVQVTYGQIPAGQTQTVTVVAKVDPSLGNGTVLTNVAGASSDQVNVDPATATASSAVIVLNGVPIAVGSLPASGTGPTSTFTYTFTDKYDFTNLFIVNVLINNGLDARNACYLAYIVPSQTLVLVNDTGDQGGNFAGTVGLGSNAVIQNSQCAVSLVSAVGNGPTLTLQLNITFKPSFGGNKIAFVAARNQALDNSDWQVLGVWQAPWTPGGTISVNGMTPARGSMPAGTLQAYSFTFTDTRGAADVGIVDILINNGLDGKSACYLAYVSSINKILLLNDAGDQGGNFIGSITPGDPTSIENSQCVLNGSGGGVAKNGQTFTLTFNLTFKAAFKGNRIIYLAARDQTFLNNTDWQAMGSWGVQ